MTLFYQMQINCLSSPWGESITVILLLFFINLEDAGSYRMFEKNPGVSILLCEATGYYEIF